MAESELEMPESIMMEEFGLTAEEAVDASLVARALLDNPITQAALRELEAGAPDVSALSRNLLHDHCFTLLSKAGFALAAGMGGDANETLRPFEGYVRQLITDPVMVRDLSHWVLFFALREASDRFRVMDCRAPQSEAHLDGLLLDAIRAACERWAKVVESPLARYDSVTVLQKIDLSLLGGEQATGGDIGLILDLDGRSIQPSDENPLKTRARRIVPIVLQSKRYTRPTANISQHHKVRGYQRHLLGRNDCTSAYLLYENGSEAIASPLPPIIKPIAAVADLNTTCAVEGGFDLAAYMMGALQDEVRYPGAATPVEALRMIFTKGTPSHLAVIAGDRRTVAYYMTEFQVLAPEIRRKGKDQEPWIRN